MRNLFSTLACILLFQTAVLAQKADSAQAVAAITKFQAELNKSYKDAEHSPLDEKARKKFKAHAFFPINLKYRVKAKLKTTPNEDFFEMKTTSGKTKLYRKYGELTFTLDGKSYQLNVYQGKALMERDEYKDYLFLPFKDHTSGNQTYGGGRYIDLRIPAEGDEIWIDFNQAYNPYCAYSDKYSCPVVPVENYLETEIKAGILLEEKH